MFVIPSTWLGLVDLLALMVFVLSLIAMVRCVIGRRDPKRLQLALGLFSLLFWIHSWGNYLRSDTTNLGITFFSAVLLTFSALLIPRMMARL